MDTRDIFDMVNDRLLCGIYNVYFECPLDDWKRELETWTCEQNPDEEGIQLS